MLSYQREKKGFEGVLGGLSMGFAHELAEHQPTHGMW